MTFGFASPWLLFLLLAVPLLLLAPRLAGSLFRPGTLRYGDTGLTALRGRSRRLAARGLPTALRLLALVLVIVALARPQTGLKREVVTGEGVDIALVLDISGSMSALDLGQHDRLEAAKLAIADFVAERRNDRIGLVVFAESAFLQSPATLDHGVLAQLTDRVDFAKNLGLQDGTAIGLGLANGANMLRESKAESKVIVLLTDGVNNSGEIDPLTAAAAAAALGIKVYTIGVGRPGIVPVRVQDLFGDRVVYRQSELDEETLRQIADITDARYFLATDTEALIEVYDEINQLEKSELEVHEFSEHTELAAWLVIPALALLVLEAGLARTLFRKVP